MRRIPALVLFLSAVIVFLAGCSQKPEEASTEETSPGLEVRIPALRFKPGDRVPVEVILHGGRLTGEVPLEVWLLRPSGRPLKLNLNPEGKKLASPAKTGFRTEIELEPDSSEGLYVITASAQIGRKKVAAKASFLVGSLVGDFMIVNYLDGETPAALEQDLRSYFRKFREIGGNLVIVHSLITPEKAYYPSAICGKAAAKGSSDDRVGLALRLAAEYGLACFLSVSWDMTREMPQSEFLESTRKVMAELWSLYGSEPSLAGFYSYQEGSGTYLAWQMREFAAAAKALNRGLLVSCSPYIDDPLLAGYLAAIDDLDIVIYQGAVMASYRPDNRRCFPLHRVKDFASLSAGATRVRNKITLSHVELFGYLEKKYAGEYLASPKDIEGQILSAAACYGPEGIVFFTWHYNIHHMGKKLAAVADCELAVSEGLAAFRQVAGKAAAASSHVGLYLPYSDWWCDRWVNSVVPALEAFRILGISPDIIPFVPPRGEEILPYYPYQVNQEQLDFLLANRYVLVLPDIAGLQDTDSRLIKEFVSQGGVVVLFGPHIPYGDGWERQELYGASEEQPRIQGSLVIKKEMGPRLRPGDRLVLPADEVSSWKATRAAVLATFGDGRGAVLASEYGQGLVVIVPFSLSPKTAAWPSLRTLFLDILDLALERLAIRRHFEVTGTPALCLDDIAEAEVGGVSYLAVMRYEGFGVSFSLKLLNLRPGVNYLLKNELSGATIAEFSGQNPPVKYLEFADRRFVLLSLAEK